MQAPDIEAWADAQCRLLGLELAAEHRPGVLHYLRLVHGMAPLSWTCRSAPADESGTVFVPVDAATGRNAAERSSVLVEAQLGAHQATARPRQRLHRGARRSGR